MGRPFADAYASAREVFEQADDALGIPLSKTVFDGSDEELKRTEITQPAILTTSIATLRAIQTERPELRPDFAAGHSLGEWSALVAVGALSFVDAVRLVRLRGQFMQEAVPFGVGAMAAVVGVDIRTVEWACDQAASETGHVIAPANMNSMEQTVISGATDAVERAGELCRDQGAKRVVALPVSAPFHCALMQPASDRLRDALEGVDVGPLDAPVISNVDAEPHREPSRVKELLIRQVTSPVRWVETTQHAVRDGTNRAIEIGPGKVLAGLVKRIDRSLKVQTTEDVDAMKNALEALG